MQLYGDVEVALLQLEVPDVDQLVQVGNLQGHQVLDGLPVSVDPLDGVPDGAAFPSGVISTSGRRGRGRISPS